MCISEVFVTNGVRNTQTSVRQGGASFDFSSLVSKGAYYLSDLDNTSILLN